MGINSSYSKSELLCTGTDRKPKTKGFKFCEGRRTHRVPGSSLASEFGARYDPPRRPD